MTNTQPTGANRRDVKDFETATLRALAAMRQPSQAGRPDLPSA